MTLATILPTLLGLAWLLPLAAFVLILFFGPRMGKAGRYAAYVATAAIITAFAGVRPLLRSGAGPAALPHLRPSAPASTS